MLQPERSATAGYEQRMGACTRASRRRPEDPVMAKPCAVPRAVEVVDHPAPPRPPSTAPAAPADVAAAPDIPASSAGATLGRTEAGPAFPWLRLPVELRELVMDWLPLDDLYSLQEVAPEHGLRARLDRRTAQAKGLWDVMSAGEQRATPRPCEFVARKELDLFLAGLDELPPGIGEMRSLVTLDLRCNHLTTLPDELAMCSRLKRLFLVKNPLGTALPPVVNRMRSLEVLSLVGYPLTHLPEDIGLRLPYLREVFVYGCPLLSIPRTLVEALVRRKAEDPSILVRIEVYNSAIPERDRDAVVRRLRANRVAAVIASM